jgi:hypothetical protein
MEVVTQASENTGKWTEGLEVEYSNSMIQLTAGAFVDRNGRHELPEVTFDIAVGTESVYALFIVDSAGEYTYELIQAIDGFPVYEGTDRLIHKHLWVDVLKQETRIFPVSKKENVEPGVVQDETEPENPTRQP